MRGRQPWITTRSSSLRSQETSAEGRLWHELRARRLGGFKFVRQWPIAGYFADFVCRERKLIVEVDGATHSTAAEQAYDHVRTEVLRSQGYRVVRMTNTDVAENLDGVLEELLAILRGEL